MPEDIIKTEWELDTRLAIYNLDRLMSAFKKATQHSKFFSKVTSDINLNFLKQKHTTDFIDKMAMKIVNTNVMKQQQIQKEKELSKIERERAKQNAEMDKFYKELDRAKQKALEEERKGQELVAKAKEHNLRMTQKEIDKVNKVRRSYMGLGFAALFGGMAIKRAFSSALKSVFKTYNDIIDKNSVFKQMTNQLTGAWEFFKFTLVDALMQTGLFQMMIGFVLKLVTWVSKLSPETKSALMVFMVIAVILGTIAMIAGQVGLAIIAWKVASTESLLSMTTKGSKFATFMVGYFKYVGDNAKELFGGIYNFFKNFLLKISEKILASKIFTTWFTSIGKWGKKTFKTLYGNFKKFNMNTVFGMAVMLVAWKTMFKDMNQYGADAMTNVFFKITSKMKAGVYYMVGLWNKFMDWIKGTGRDEWYVENGMYKLREKKYLSYNEILDQVIAEEKANGGFATDLATALGGTTRTLMSIGEGYMLGGIGGAVLGAGLDLNEMIKGTGISPNAIKYNTGLNLDSLSLDKATFDVGDDKLNLSDISFKEYEETKEMKELTSKQLEEHEETNSLLNLINKSNEDIANSLNLSLNKFNEITSSTGK